MVREIPPGLVFAFLASVGLLLGVYLVALRLATGSGGAARARVRRHALHAAIFYATFAIYLANAKRHLQVDTQPVAFTAMSLVRQGWFDLTPFEANIAPLKTAVCMRGADGRTYSVAPPAIAIACVPFVLSFANARYFTFEQLDFASKRAGALCAALSVVVMFAALRRLGLGRAAWVATIAYAFGTTLFSSASQDTWQHAPAMLGLAIVLYGIARTYPEEPRSAALVGAGLAWAFLSRPTMAAPAAIVALHFLVRDRRRFLWLALGALPFALFWLDYAWEVYGSPLRTGYSGRHEMGVAPGFGHNLWSTFFDENRGIFVYSPFLLLGLGGFWPLLRALPGRRPADERLAAVATFALSGFAVAAVVALVGLWPGGWSYGYRTSSECATLLLPPFALVAERLWRLIPGRILVALMIAASIAIHALEYAFPNDVWNAKPELQARYSQIRVHWWVARARLGG